MGLLPTAVVDSLTETADILFLLAFAGLGLDIRANELRSAGLTPVLVVGLCLIVVSALTFLLIHALL
jgi:uncharacterized membrane protein YadS